MLGFLLENHQKLEGGAVLNNFSHHVICGRHLKTFGLKLIKDCDIFNWNFLPITNRNILPLV